MASVRRGAPLWFRMVAILLLLWAFGGCYACFQQFRIGAESWGGHSDYDRALYAALPVWYNAVFAVAVGTSFLGALALIARSVLSVPLFVLSLIAALIQFGWLFATTDIVAHKGAGVVLPFPILILGVTLFGWWLARHARARGWIG